MNLKCLFGSHIWDGCKCKSCGETRNEGHDWNGCMCGKCGKTRDEGHDWVTGKCSKCGVFKLKHEIGIDGLCKICGCSAIAIHKFNWGCKDINNTTQIGSTIQNGEESELMRQWKQRRLMCGLENALTPDNVGCEDNHGHQWTDDRNEPIARKLIEEHPELHSVKTSDGTTPLHWAADHCKKELVKLLIANGADVNAKNKFDETPLHIASTRRSAYPREEEDIIEMLLANGADINAKTKAGRTPLHQAVVMRCKDHAELLLYNHADVNAKDKDGFTPLHLAKNQNDWDTAGLLGEHGGKG